MGARAAVGWNGNQYTNLGSAESALPKTTADIAIEVGLSKRRTQERKQIPNKLADEVKDTIRDTELADKATDLLQLARLSEPEQMTVAQQRKRELPLPLLVTIAGIF